MGANLANAFARDLGYEVRVVSFFKSGATPFYPLDSRVSCVYLCNNPAKGKNALINLFNKTLFRAWLCFKAHRFATQSDIILANDGWFVPLFRDSNSSLRGESNANESSLRGEAEAIHESKMDCHEFDKSNSRNDKKARFFVRLWHINAPKRARQKLRLFDALVILSEREMGRWQRYHSNVKVIPNFLPTIPQVSTNHSQKVVLSVGRMSSEKGFLRLLDIWKMVQTKIIDCHDSALPNLAMTGGESLLRGESNAHESSLQNSTKYATFSSLRGEAEAIHESKMDCYEFDKSNSRNDGVENDLNEWKLIIVGDGVLKSEIESKIRALNLGESVLLKPFTKDIGSEYLGASIYAMASHFEGFPMVLLESTAYGLAPISFDIATGPSDIIKNNKSGFLIADNDLESYANHLIKLMSDENLRAQFGAESRKIVRENFSKEVIMEKWRKLLEI